MTLRTFKREYLKFLNLLLSTKVEGRLSDFDRESFLEALGRPSVRYPITSRYTGYRKEGSNNYVVVCGDAVYLADEETIFLLEQCKGYNTTKEIAELFSRRFKISMEEAVRKVETFLRKGAEFGIIHWIPISPAHKMLISGGEHDDY